MLTMTMTNAGSLGMLDTIRRDTLKAMLTKMELWSASGIRLVSVNCGATGEERFYSQKTGKYYNFLNDGIAHGADEGSIRRVEYDEYIEAGIGLYEGGPHIPADCKTGGWILEIIEALKKQLAALALLSASATTGPTPQLPAPPPSTPTRMSTGAKIGVAAAAVGVLALLGVVVASATKN